MKLLGAMFGVVLSLTSAGAMAANCGGDGQYPCIKIPPCDSNLTINPSNGRCYRPNCGRHNQTACKPNVRLQSCDWGFLPDPANGWKCVEPKETVAAKEIEWATRQETCKAAVSTILSGKLPPELQPLLKAVTPQQFNAIGSKLKSPETQNAMKTYLEQQNPELAKEIFLVAVRIQKASADFRKLFQPDNICGRHTAKEWTTALQSKGFLPSDQVLNSIGTPFNCSNSHPCWYLIRLEGETTFSYVKGALGIGALVPIWPPTTRNLPMYVVFLGSVGANTGNIAVGGNLGVSLFAGSTVDEHLGETVGASVSGSVGTDIIKHIAAVASGGAAAELEFVPGWTGSIEVGWDDVPNHLFKGQLVPTGLGILTGPDYGLIPVQINVTAEFGKELWHWPR